MNTWEVKQFSCNEIRDSINDKKFVVPPFQRNLVWKKSIKRLFVDSFENGLPFGTILLYEDEQAGNFQIIDGLQRCHTILEYVENPTEFFDETKVDSKMSEQIAKELGFGGNGQVPQSAVDHITDSFVEWVKSKHPTMADVLGIQYFNYVLFLRQEYGTLVDGHEVNIIEIIKPTVDAYKNRCEALSNIAVPAIIVKGDKSSLPEIFRRINTGGVQLNKYQIFAATWMPTSFLLTDDSLTPLIDANVQRYLRMHGNIGTSDFDPQKFISEKMLDAFELCFGFGKMLSSKYPYLFGKNDNTEEVDSHAFTLLNMCVGNKYTEMARLPELLEQVVGSDNISLFLNRILSSVAFVDKQIGKYNKFKLNSKSIVGPLHSELQLVSMIGSVFLSRYASVVYDDDGALESVELDMAHTNSRWNSGLEASYKKNLRKRYITDIMNQSWRSTGNSRLDSVIGNVSYYSDDIDDTQLETTMREWYKRIKTERREREKVANPKEQDKLFLSMVYLSVFDGGDALDSSKYDVEHLATKNLLKQCLKRYDDLWLPISSIGNMCLLPYKANRSKKDKTLYDDDAYLDNCSYSLADIEEKFSFTKEEDLAWLNDDLSAEDFENSYYRYIDSHFERLLKKAMLDFT